MRKGLFMLCLLISCKLLLAQYPEKMTRPMYFDKYREIAIREMNRSGVPASITLAQGALESGDGNSRLARVANNHFGIKCHNDWDGKTILEDDETRNECFRKYASVEDSYRDHSDYLRSKTRYAFLFELNPTDYKGWARGLKKAGYATNPHYAESIIKIIEDFGLNTYDRMAVDDVKENRDKNPVAPNAAKRPVLERNRVKYILAKKGDTFESVTAELGKLSWELPQYNDLSDVDSLKAGQVVYIQPKRKRAEAGKETHIVKEGETMYTISQFYAVRLDKLYSMNNMQPGTKLVPGSVLQLRKAVRTHGRNHFRSAPVKKDLNDSDEEQIKVDW
ncbi:MAG TPA: glucosaminidase domain-containing protein [Bacteroidales bacterium]|nr:glucosaminidase domain-containing protein [Bacteroidales bacterium]